MFLTPRQLVCDACHKPIQEGQRVVTVEIGTIEKIGGLGLYKDALVLRTVTSTRQHEKCDA